MKKQITYNGVTLPQGYTRVGKCEHTNKLVVQEWTESGWLCLHNETSEEDAIAVSEFWGKNGINKEPK